MDYFDFLKAIYSKDVRSQEVLISVFGLDFQEKNEKMLLTSQSLNIENLISFRVKVSSSCFFGGQSTF